MPKPLLVPREIHVLRAFIAYFLGVFLLNHRIHHQTTEVYQNSGKGDQVQELSKCSGRTTPVAGKWIACLVQKSVNYKGFVSVNFWRVFQKNFTLSLNYLCWLLYCFLYMWWIVVWLLVFKFCIIFINTYSTPL